MRTLAKTTRANATGDERVAVARKLPNNASLTSINSFRTLVLRAACFLVCISCSVAWAQTELIKNGDFALGSNNWSLLGDFNADSRFANCRSCPGYAYVTTLDGSVGNNLSGIMRQNLSIPADAASATLSFWYYISTQESGATATDLLQVEVLSSSGSLLEVKDTLSNVNSSFGYVRRSIDLSSHRGESIWIQFRATTDAIRPTTFRIDDVSLQVLGPLRIVSVEPLSGQMRDWGQKVTYTIRVQDSAGAPVSGATVNGSDDLRRLSFTTSPLTTDGGGRVTYETLVPSGTLNGNYVVSFVAFKTGFGTSAQVIRTVIVLHDSSRPTARLAARDVTSSNDSFITFDVVYTDNSAIKVSDIDNNDLRVTGPNGFSQLPRLLRVSSGNDGSERTATYRIDAPQGKWTRADNGVYTVEIKSFQVSDTSGNFIDAGVLGTFRVSIPNTAPSVSIISPASGAQFLVGSEIPIQATASDSDGRIAQVEFYANGVQVGSNEFVFPFFPFSFVWRNAPLGTHILTLRAVDDLGALTISSPITVTVVGKGFVVVDFTPREAVAGGAGWRVIGGSPSWQEQGTTVALAAGSNSIEFKPVAGFLEPVPMNVRVMADEILSLRIGYSPSASAPTITAQPKSLQVVRDSDAGFTVLANGSIPLFYQWLFNGAEVAGGTNATLSLNRVQKASVGGYRVIITNTLGSATSVAARLDVNDPPQSRIINLANGATFSLGSTILVTAFAFDPDGIVSSVELLALSDTSTNVIGTMTNSTSLNDYAFNWTNALIGEYRLVAKVYDDLGVSRFSPAIFVTVLPRPQPRTVFFDRPEYWFDENTGQAIITVRKEGVGIASVDYITEDETAVSIDDFSRGVFHDFVGKTGTLFFSTNQAMDTIAISITDDFIEEPEESFFIRLRDPGSDTTLGSAVARVFIRPSEVGTNERSLFDFRRPRSLEANSLGGLRVEILDDSGRGNWRLPWETSWRDSLSVANGLEPGEYNVEFRPIAGFTNSLTDRVSVTEGTVRQFTKSYRRSNAAPSTGNLRINVEPSGVLNEFAWRLGASEAWQGSGAVLTLPPGRHLVEFTNVIGWNRPDPLIAQVFSDGETEWNVAYESKANLPQNAQLPEALPRYSSISSGANLIPRLPFQFCGQLHSSAGFGSGFAVRPKVVLTAAHVVFDDVTLKMVEFVDWFPQRFAGEYEPQPMRAKGWFVMPGYVEERRAERASGASPREARPGSQALDVAALYFDQDVVRGGFSGYLVVGSGTNNWLDFADDTLLVGYPIEGPTDRIRPGRMHSVRVFEGAFSKVFSDNSRLYQSRSFLSFPGTSGGPVCVPVPVGAADIAYFPAGVYLGQNQENSIVRAIDTNVVALINLAATAALVAENSTGGGAIKPGTPIPSQGQFGIVDVTVMLEPPEAIAAGAGWRFTASTQAFTTSAVAMAKLVYGYPYQMEFNTNVTGFEAPRVRPFVVDGVQKLTLNISYVRPQLSLRSTNELWLSGPVNRDYLIRSRSTLGPGTPWEEWRKVTLTNSPQAVLLPKDLSSQAFFQAILRPP